MRKKLNKKAFTLIELLVVIAVIGILVLFGAPRFKGHTQRAELTRIQHDIKVMEQEVGTVLTNKDDDFNNWENNNKDLNQLIQEGKLFEKEGVVKADLPIDETYKVIPEKHKDKINTKLKGTFYANSNGKVYYEHLKPLSGIPTEPEKEPEYSDEEIEDLKNKGFIPVATAEELNSIRNETTRTYGKGTKWEGTYTGGLDKNYVQVLDIDLSEYSKDEEGWTPIGTLDYNVESDSELFSASFKGTYDGGNYVISGLEVKGEDKDGQGLFGLIAKATIRNVDLIDNKVTGRHVVGGLVGGAFESFIENSYATGSVKGGYNVGGLVGTAENSTIENSYATGSVEGYQDVGGLVGQAYDRTKISKSYAKGEVTGSGNYVGGLVGEAFESTIETSYATGSVTGKVYVGGLVGEAWSEAGGSTINNSYATGSVTGDERVGGLVGYANTNIEISNSYATGSVTGEEWVGGLAGSANNNSKISNSYATGSVKGALSAGGLVGSTSWSKIENSYSTGPVEGSEYSGGVSVFNSGGVSLLKAQIFTNISNSYFTGSGEYIGGLVGYTYNSTINNSYATGSVTGDERVGGLVGRALDSIIEDSYATGSVTGRQFVGGLAGYANWSTKIRNSYATGLVKGPDSGNVGGLVGWAESSTEITNSYWDKETTGREKSTGAGATGMSTENMMKQTTYSGWDFDETWEIQEGVSYPTLINNPERH